jgi:oligoribonuclease
MPNLTINNNNLIWLDMEMTGLDCNQHVILEVAVVITNSNLDVLETSDSYAIYQPDDELNKMDKWNINTHSRSGLVDRVKQSEYSINYVESKILELVHKYTKKHSSPLCGNTIYQDRKFIIKYMPKLEEYLHYRNIDVSSIKELAKRWYPDIYKGFQKHNKHEALADIIESINELKYYRDNIFKTQENPASLII